MGNLSEVLGVRPVVETQDDPDPDYGWEAQIECVICHHGPCDCDIQYETWKDSRL